jgi:hypothetical protein
VAIGGLGSQWIVPRRGTRWLVVTSYGDAAPPLPVARVKVIGRTAQTKHANGFEMDVDAGWFGRDAVPANPASGGDKGPR